MSGDRDEMAIAMRSTESITSVPHGEIGCKVIITMTEETSLYEILSDAMERAKARVDTVTRDSGSDPKGENSRSEVECEASQSGPRRGASPNPNERHPDILAEIERLTNG